MERTPILKLTGVTKRFESHAALQDFHLTLMDGEFFTILGPSGCGKTTVLRLIAGLEQADEGEILLENHDIVGAAAEERPVNTVFQSYALFPHMTVFDNIAFGLRIAGLRKQEIQKRVEEAIAMVRLSGMEQRKPHQLSGGQKQRVAIARAVINRPKVLLLDESLSALDYKLRQQMQVELKQLQRKLGITFVFVTHDQQEALSMSDRVMVMHNGQVQQVGTPREIYEMPKNLFVARFIGEVNIFDGEVLKEIEHFKYIVQFESTTKIVHTEQRFESGDPVHVILRPEDLRVEVQEADLKDRNGFVGKVLETSYTGLALNSFIQLENGQKLITHEFFNEDDPDFDYRINQKVWVDWIPGWEHVIRREG